MKTALMCLLVVLLVALLAPAPPSAQEAKPGGQVPPAENPIPQEPPVVEEPVRTPQPPPPPPAPAAPAMVTLGEFAARAATGLKLPAPQGGFTPESAAWALVQKGVKLRPDLSSPLTEGDAVGALTGVGYRIRTMTPSRVVSRERFEILIDSFFTGEVKPLAPAPPAAAAPRPAPAPVPTPPPQDKP